MEELAKEAIDKIKDFEDNKVGLSFVIGYLCGALEADFLLESYNTYSKLNNSPIAIHESGKPDDIVTLFDNNGTIIDECGVRQLILFRVNHFNFINKILNNTAEFNEIVVEELVDSIDFLVF